MTDDTNCLDVDTASNYVDVALLISKHSANERIHTVHVMSEFLMNPTRAEFESIVSAVYAMPSVRRFGIFCWSIPPGAAASLIRLMADRTLITRISLLGNSMSRVDMAELEAAMVQAGIVGRVTLEPGYAIRDPA